MQGTYNLWLVALSLIVATLASYTALDLSGRISLLTRCAGGVNYCFVRRTEFGRLQ